MKRGRIIKSINKGIYRACFKVVLLFSVLMIIPCSVPVVMAQGYAVKQEIITQDDTTVILFKFTVTLDNNQPFPGMHVILPFAINECIDGGPHQFYTEPTDEKGEVTVFLPSTMLLSTVTYGDAMEVISSDGPNMSAGFSANSLSASSNSSKTFGCCQTIRASCNALPPASEHDKCYHGGGDAIKLCEKLKDQIKPPCGSVLWTSPSKGCNQRTGKCEDEQTSSTTTTSVLPTTIPTTSTTTTSVLPTTIPTTSSTIPSTTTTDQPTAITLASFDVKPGNRSVKIVWETGDETDNLGFNIYRAESKDGAYKKINQSLIASKVGSGLGTSYEFIDNNIKNLKIYFYKLEDVDVNGAVTQHGPIAATPRLIYGLFQ